jgi:hypothetical protein
MTNKSAHSRLQVHVENLGVAVDSVRETRGSLIAIGHRSAIPVVLKVVKRHGDEWFSGAVVESFGGRGLVRIHEPAEAPGALTDPSVIERRLRQLSSVPHLDPHAYWAGRSRNQCCP